MGDAEFFNIGQDGYCGKRAIVDSPASKTFLLPSGKTTWFRMSSRLRVPTATYSCSGEYSFLPVAGKLHILRYSVVADGCLFEHFMGEPSGTPAPAPIQQGEPRSCLLQ